MFTKKSHDSLFLNAGKVSHKRDLLLGAGKVSLKKALKILLKELEWFFLIVLRK